MLSALFQPCTVLQSKPPPSSQTVNNNEGQCKIFSQKEQRKPSKMKNEKSSIAVLKFGLKYLRSFNDPGSGLPKDTPLISI